MKETPIYRLIMDYYYADNLRNPIMEDFRSNLQLEVINQMEEKYKNLYAHRYDDECNAYQCKELDKKANLITDCAIDLIYYGYHEVLWNEDVLKTSSRYEDMKKTEDMYLDAMEAISKMLGVYGLFWFMAR